MLDLGNGLILIIGGFIEIDAADEKAVVLTYVGGSKRVLDEPQSERFLIGVGLKESRTATQGGLYD